MNESETSDELVDRFVEQVMLGEAPDVEDVIARTPDMTSETREKLRRLAVAFQPGNLDPPVYESAHSEASPSALGPYKLLSVMGEGGMGVVYLAEHEFLRRRVALKVIRPELAMSKTARARFQREAMRVASLRHENIVSVYDAGEQDGVAFLAMEVVEGPGLDDVLKSARETGERVDVATAVRQARDVARALQCAHDAGIVHRDVKPSNVRITPDGRALLLDFGLSLADDAVSVSSLGMFRGTPAYASPEQIELSAEELDARTDVYSLGLTLYECLTGEMPFTGSNSIQLFNRILTKVPPRPRELDPRIDAVLDGIVMRSIAKRREERFDSAKEMADALDGWLATAGTPDPATLRRRELAHRASSAVAAVAVVVLAWSLFRDVSAAKSATQLDGQPVVLTAPRTTVPLLGSTDEEPTQRLRGWIHPIGGGTFGADMDGPGVTGTSLGGITAATFDLSAKDCVVRGSIEPFAPDPDTRTRGAGAGLELSNGHIVALLLASTRDGYEVRVCELSRDGTSGLIRGADLLSRPVSSGEGRPLGFHLSWNDTDTSFEWVDEDAKANSSSFLIPRGLRGDTRPARFLLIVERGGGRFEELVLERS